MNFKKLGKISSGALALALLVPMLASAQGAAPAQNRACEKLTQIKTRVDKGIYSKEINLKSKREERKIRINERWEKRDQTIKENRVKKEGNQSEHFARLEAKASTDSEKQAVAAFKEAVRKAASDRQSAIDSAIKAYRDGVEQALDGRKGTLDSLVSSFKSSVEAAITQAVSDCQSGQNPKDVRLALEGKLKDAREKLQADRKALEKGGDIIKPLIETRDLAFKNAKDNFKAALEKAAQDLKTAFPASSQKN